MIDEAAVRDWFFREIFPLEAALTRYLRRNWRNDGEIADLRQDIYAKVYGAAKDSLPLQARAFLFTTARNHLINQSRRGKVVSIDQVADLESPAVEYVTPERLLTARDELRLLQAGLDRLPPRCREVVVLRKIEGLSPSEIAVRMNLSVRTVDNQLMFGMRALADFMLGGAGRIQRGVGRPRRSQGTAAGERR